MFDGLRIDPNTIETDMNNTERSQDSIIQQVDRSIIQEKYDTEDVIDCLQKFTVLVVYQFILYMDRHTQAQINGAVKDSKKIKELWDKDPLKYRYNYKIINTSTIIEFSQFSGSLGLGDISSFKVLFSKFFVELREAYRTISDDISNPSGTCVIIKGDVKNPKSRFGAFFDKSGGYQICSNAAKTINNMEHDVNRSRITELEIKYTSLENYVNELKRKTIPIDPTDLSLSQNNGQSKKKKVVINEQPVNEQQLKEREERQKEKERIAKQNGGHLGNGSEEWETVILESGSMMGNKISFDQTTQKEHDEMKLKSEQEKEEKRKKEADEIMELKNKATQLLMESKKEAEEKEKLRLEKEEKIRLEKEEEKKEKERLKLINEAKELQRLENLRLAKMKLEKEKERAKIEADEKEKERIRIETKAKEDELRRNKWTHEDIWIIDSELSELYPTVLNATFSNLGIIVSGVNNKITANGRESSKLIKERKKSFGGDEHKRTRHKLGKISQLIRTIHQFKIYKETAKEKLKCQISKHSIKNGKKYSKFVTKSKINEDLVAPICSKCEAIIYPWILQCKGGYHKRDTFKQWLSGNGKKVTVDMIKYDKDYYNHVTTLKKLIFTDAMNMFKDELNKIK